MATGKKIWLIDKRIEELKTRAFLREIDPMNVDELIELRDTLIKLDSGEIRWKNKKNDIVIK